MAIILCFASAHNIIYLSAFDMFLDNKIIGIGPKNYRKFCKEEYNNYFEIYEGDCFSHPHNTYPASYRNWDIGFNTNINSFYFYYIIF